MKNGFLCPLLFMLLAGTAQAVEYGDGWKETCQADGKCSYSNYNTIQRWDGEYIPYENLSLWGGQWTYFISENATHYDLLRLGEILSLPKSYGNYTFGLTEVSLEFTVTPSQLNSKSTANGSGQWYITIPDKATKTRFIWDNKKPIVSNNTGDILDENTYWYSVVNDKRRLNYNQTARNFGIASQNVTFSFDSWTVGSGGSAWDGNSSFDNVTENQGINFIELDQIITSFRYWRGDGNSKDDNRTTIPDDGTPTAGFVYNASGKYGSAFQTNSTQDVDFSKINFLSNQSFTLACWIYMTAGQTGTFSTPCGQENSFWISVRTDRFLFGVRNTTTYSTAVYFTTVNLNQWYFVLGTRNVSNNNVTTLYIDGISRATSNLGGNPRSDIANYVEVGNNYLGDSPFYGLVDDVRIINYSVSIDETNFIMNQSKYTSGNLTTWHDSGSGNETYQIDVNVTTTANTNYSVYYRQNQTGSMVLLGSAQTGNNSYSISSKYQDTEINVTLFGNTTETPELTQITFWTQVVSGGGTPDYIPPAPINLVNTTGNFWVNHTWAAGAGNITNSYNVSQNGTWTNGSANTYFNASVGAGNWSNITVWAWNSSGVGTLSTGSVSQNTQAPASFTPSNVTISCPVGWCYLAMNRTNYTLSEIDTIYSTDTVQSRYNSTSQRYESHRTGYSSNQNSNVAQKSGYAYYFTVATPVVVNLTTNPSITLNAGWNLVGNMQGSRNLSELKSSVGVEATQARHFNPSSQSWVSSDSEAVPAGEAFFVYLTAAKAWGG